MFKEKVNKYQEETNKFLNKWEEKSREFIHNFLDIFENRANEIKDRVQRAISPRPNTRSSAGKNRQRSQSRDDLFNANGKRASSDSGEGSKRAKYYHEAAAASSGDDDGEDEQEEDYFSTDEALASFNASAISSSKSSLSTLTGKQSQQVSSTYKLKSRLKKSIKKFTTSQFEELADVDDEIDNQIPVI